MAQPEKISFWDRMFNRTRREVIERGQDRWHKTLNGQKVIGSEYTRDFVVYRVIDRVTGSETIEKKYLN